MELKRVFVCVAALGTAAVIAGVLVSTCRAGRSVLDSNLQVRQVVGDLDQPTSMAFIGANDFLVLEKATGWSSTS